MKVLAGDIGGTNTRLMFSEVKDLSYLPIAEKSYPSNQYANLQQVINCFIGDFKITGMIQAACFAVAGPVKHGEAKITNLPWKISEEQLSNTLKIPTVKLVNDFTAVAQGIPMLSDEDCLYIQNGREKNNSRRHPDAAIIGAGTGLGASHRVWIDDKYHIFPSETGHIGFTPANEPQTKLLSWLQSQHKHVSLEMVLSGSGIYNIYRFLREQSYYSESTTIKKAIQDTDPAVVITQHGLKRDDELCSKTLEMFVEIYGSIAGDVALHYYPVDDVYIAGGIAPKIKDKLASQIFLNSFINKGLMSSNMKKINIKIILNDKVGLYGALSNMKD